MPMPLEFVITAENAKHVAFVSKPNGESLARLLRAKDGTTTVELSNGEIWGISHKIDNEVRPFSLKIERLGNDQARISLPEKESRREEETRKVILKVKEHMFSYKGNMYMIGNVPEGKSYRDLFSGRKYISRLVNFPFSDPSDVDVEWKNRLRRIRGIPMGEISGIGIGGHRVELRGELEEIGLPVAVSTYILYTTGSVHPSKSGGFEKNSGKEPVPSPAN